MHGRVYSTEFSGSAQTTQVDFFEIVAPSDAVVEILEFHLSQTSEVSDAQEEMLLVQVKTGASTSGSGGSSGTAVPRQAGDAAFGGTVEYCNTTKASSGTIVTHLSTGWNIRVPLDVIFTPETTIIVSPGVRLTVELGTTPGDSITFAGYIVYREIGG